ncbi:MAG: hypothetical protein UHD09_01395 [Bifidobacterium sp.]|nr:hypothetical protein [Bifidobacterium sp.]
MEFDHEGAVERVAAVPSVREAAHDGVELTRLWPLTAALQLDNDARYAENLQVRLTRLAASVATGADVAMADAEFVYEGADTIPGRPQEMVDALVAANDAYEAAVPEEGSAAMPSTATVEEVQQLLGAGWSGQTCTKVGARFESCAAFLAREADRHVGDLAWRFAVVVTLLDVAMRDVRAQVVGTLGADTPHEGGLPNDRVRVLERACMPLLFLAQAPGESIGVPPIAMTTGQWHGVVAAYGTMNGDSDALDSAAVLGEELAPIAVAEWRKHREDILWDPEEAKKRAREEDERKNKEALAAKFAHVKDDPGKETVEL